MEPTGTHWDIFKNLPGILGIHWDSTGKGGSVISTAQMWLTFSTPGRTSQKVYRAAQCRE